MMSGFLLHEGATVQCLHAGQATPVTPNPRVTVSGNRITTRATSYTVAGCSLSSPCTTAQWISAATRVKAGGFPVLLKSSQASCVPTGTGLNILVTQMRVKGM